jgi:hypothetical protein
VTAKIERVTLYIATEISQMSEWDMTSAMDNVLSMIDEHLYDTVVFSYESEEMEIAVKTKRWILSTKSRSTIKMERSFTHPTKPVHT